MSNSGFRYKTKDGNEIYFNPKTNQAEFTKPVEYKEIPSMSVDWNLCPHFQGVKARIKAQEDVNMQNVQSLATLFEENKTDRHELAELNKTLAVWVEALTAHVTANERHFVAMSQTSNEIGDRMEKHIEAVDLRLTKQVQNMTTSLHNEVIGVRADLLKHMEEEEAEQKEATKERKQTNLWIKSQVITLLISICGGVTVLIIGNPFQ